MIKQCKYCGKEFEPVGRQIYCSKTCRRKFYNQKYREEEKAYRKKYYEVHRDYFKEYRKKYYRDHKDYLKEYYRRYRQDHKDKLKEYRRKYNMKYQKEGIKDSQYPCFEYIGHYVDKIPSEMCLNCSAERCRFDHN